MIRAIAARLDRLSDERLREITYHVSDWMHRIEARLYGDASRLLPKLWRVVVRALRKEPTHVADRSDTSWADSALNAPVGRLFDLLHDDPGIQDRATATGLPVDWQNRVEELFALPGEKRCHAVVLASHNIGWFDRVDPAWTEQNLLPLTASESADGDAFWDGIIWSGGNGLNDAGGSRGRTRGDLCPVAADQSKRLDTRIASNVVLPGDRPLQTQMISNLLENAMEHTPEGTRITVQLDSTESGHRLVVEDDGPGIPSAETERIFDRFYRRDQNSSTRRNGLGLCLVRSISGLHGFVVCLDANASRSRFEFTM